MGALLSSRSLSIAWVGADSSRCARRIAEYLKQMSNISMLVSLSRQVWDDLPLSTHKCAAALPFRPMNE